MRDLVIKNLIKNLDDARENAVAAKMDFHFVSEIEHLTATAKANLSEGKDTQ